MTPRLDYQWMTWDGRAGLAADLSGRLLRENPALLQLYQDLVITRIATADEFWAQHAAEFINKTSSKQDVGVSGAFLVSPAAGTALVRG